jgi:hypothetical protein
VLELDYIYFIIIEGEGREGGNIKVRWGFKKGVGRVEEDDQ